jgi:membrane protease YdiL (CAAX protease family)
MLIGTFAGAAAFFIINFLPQLFNSPLQLVGLPEQEFSIFYILSSNHTLWLAFNSYLLFRGIAQEIIWRKVWKNKLI